MNNPFLCIYKTLAWKGWNWIIVDNKKIEKTLHQSHVFIIKSANFTNCPHSSEVVNWRCTAKKLLHKNSYNAKERTGASLLKIKLPAVGLKLHLKELRHRCFPVYFPCIFRNFRKQLFIEHLSAAASSPTFNKCVGNVSFVFVELITYHIDKAILQLWISFYQVKNMYKRNNFSHDNLVQFFWENLLLTSWQLRVPSQQ